MYKDCKVPKENVAKDMYKVYRLIKLLYIIILLLSESDKIKYYKII